MNHFDKIAEGIDVSGVRAEIAAHPELWGAHPGRTGSESPHYGVPDIWVRYRAPEELVDQAAFRGPHFSAFYPAWQAIPSLEKIVFELMSKVRPRATMLGGILITKIPAGGSVKPHHDRGGWHAEFYNTKIYVALQSNDQCVNHCEDESCVIREGEAVIFNNLLTHSVENNGSTDRMTLIICLRTEK